MMEPVRTERWKVERVPTGIDHLDALTDGGLTRGSLVLVVGGPGTGKTILAQQMAFAWAARGENTLWLVTLGEPNEKFLTNITEMSYYDRQQIGTRIQLVNLTRYLRKGFEEQLAAIRQTMRTGDYAYVVIDGFQSFRCFMEGEREVRFFLSELGAELALAGVTLIVTVDEDLAHYSEAAEFTMADAIIALDRVRFEGREQRRLHITKLRGRAAIGGYHTFHIDDQGLHLHPRIESLLPSEQPDEELTQVPFGVAGIDELLHGGPLQGSTTLLAGSIGTGKSMLASCFLSEGIRREERCLNLCLFDRLPGFLQRGGSFGLPLRDGVERGLLTVKAFDPAHWDPDGCAWEVVQAVEEQGIHRLVIDGVTPIERGLEGSGRTLDYFTALVDYLQAHRVTTVFTYELPDLLGLDVRFPTPVIGQVASNLILLRFAAVEKRLARILVVVKARYAQHSSVEAELLFDAGRLSVVPRTEQEQEPALAS